MFSHSQLCKYEQNLHKSINITLCRQHIEVYRHFIEIFLIIMYAYAQYMYFIYIYYIVLLCFHTPFICIVLLCSHFTSIVRIFIYFLYVNNYRCRCNVIKNYSLSNLCILKSYTYTTLNKMNKIAKNIVVYLIRWSTMKNKQYSNLEHDYYKYYVYTIHLHVL